MIDHHQMGVDMAGRCAKQAVHAPLRNLARKIAATQSSEIEMMQGWLEDWYTKSHSDAIADAKEAVDRAEHTELSGMAQETIE